MKLSAFAIGQAGRIVQVGGEGALRRRLLEMGLTPRTEITVRKKAPFGDPIQVTVRGYELTLRLADAERIEMTEANT